MSSTQVVEKINWLAEMGHNCRSYFQRGGRYMYKNSRSQGILCSFSAFSWDGVELCRGNFRKNRPKCQFY